MRYLTLVILIPSFFFFEKLNAQINCNSPAGITALMAAPVIVNPTDVDDFGGSNLSVKGQTKIFLSPPSTIPTECVNAVSIFVFYSASETELSNYPALASRDLSNLFAKKNISVTQSNTSDPNIKNCAATIPRVGLVEGQIIYYRWAKMIDQASGLDPVVWSRTLSFTVNKEVVSGLKFDVELELDRMVVANVKDIDGTEDLKGHIYFYSLKALAKLNNTEKLLWKPKEIMSRREGSYQINKRIPLIPNLSLDELKNLEIETGGLLFDEESFPIIVPKMFYLSERQPNLKFTRILKFIGSQTTQEAIINLRNDGTFQALKFGGDDRFELNWYEEDIKQNGWVKFLFKVWVKPHQ